MRWISPEGLTSKGKMAEFAGERACSGFHDQLLMMNNQRRPLHGLPILLKETLGTQDEMSTSGELPVLKTCPY